MTKRKKPIADVLASVPCLISYCPDTGEVRFLADRGPRKKGEKVGHSEKGYFRTEIDGHSFYVHRLAWFIHYGDWPDEIDHVNGIRSDNRICNLRAVTRSVNQQNRSKYSSRRCLPVGVRVHSCGKYEARIRVNGKTVSLGLFPSEQTAAEAYLTAKKEHHTGYVDERFQ